MARLDNRPYWEKEEPVVTTYEQVIVKQYLEAGKLQFFRRIDIAPHGVGKGVTIDLGCMSEDELLSMQYVVNEAISSELARQKSDKVGMVKEVVQV